MGREGSWVRGWKAVVGIAGGFCGLSSERRVARLLIRSVSLCGRVGLTLAPPVQGAYPKSRCTPGGTQAHRNRRCQGRASLAFPSETQRKEYERDVHFTRLPRDNAEA